MSSPGYNINVISRNYTQKKKEIRRKVTPSNVHKYIREYNETTGIQGLHYLTDKRSVPEKIVWGIVLLISLSGCFCMIYEILRKYQNSPIVTGFGNEPGFIHQIPFPAVTICPFTSVSNDKFNYEVIKLKLENNINLTDEERKILYYTRSICPKSASLYREDSNYTLNNEKILDVLKQVAPTAPLFSCKFMKKVYDCTKIFTRVLTDEGICYSFNVMDRSEIFKKDVFHYENFHQVGRNSSAFDGESGYNGKIGPDVYPRRNLIQGFGHGLNLGLRQIISETNEFCSMLTEGFTMKLHHPAETYEGRQNYYLLPNEKISIVSIVPELIKTSDKIESYNVEKRKCYLKGERKLKYFQIYTQSNCNFECLTNITLNKCGCVDFYMPRTNGTEFICSFEHHDCIEEARDSLYRKTIESNEANFTKTNYYFACNCLPLCTELKYNLDVTQVEIGKNFRQDNAFVSILFINFKSSSFSILEKNELYDTTDLISNFGGLLGLFTGFSFISLAEIIYFLTLRIWCNRRLYGQWSGPPNY